MKKPPQPKEITVRVIRAFRMGGEEVPADTVIVLEYRFAQELIHARKAARTEEAPRAPRGAKEASGRSAGSKRKAEAANQTANAAQVSADDANQTPADQANGE